MSNFFEGIVATKSFDSAPDIEPIPDGVTAVAMIDEAKWSEYQGESKISLRWNIVAPNEYKNRKVFQKLDVYNSAKGLKAKKMLAAIDANAGGKLLEKGTMPDDMALANNLCFKPMQIKIKVWEMDGKKGNWVVAVSSKGEVPVTPSHIAPAKAPDINSDIPF